MKRFVSNLRQNFQNKKLTKDTLFYGSTQRKNVKKCQIHDLFARISHTLSSNMTVHCAFTALR